VFDSEKKYAGRQYTATIAWLAVAVIFIPAMIFAVRPGYVTLSLAFISSVTCLVLAWGKKSSRLASAAIATQQAARND
jgi:apolipoprotein N-acyltransferase